MWPNHRERYASKHYEFLWYVEIHLYLPKKISTYDGFGFEKDTLKVDKNTMYLKKWAFIHIYINKTTIKTFIKKKKK